jgi:hypothetical protein
MAIPDRRQFNRIIANIKDHLGTQTHSRPNARFIYYSKETISAMTFEDAFALGEAPLVGRLVTIVQRDNLFLAPLARQVSRVSELKVCGSNLDKPAGINCGYLSHVFPASQHQFMVHHPSGGFGKEGA